MSKGCFLRTYLGKIVWPKNSQKTAPLNSPISTGQFLWIFGSNDFRKYVLKKTDFTILSAFPNYYFITRYEITFQYLFSGFDTIRNLWNIWENFNVWYNWKHYMHTFVRINLHCTWRYVLKFFNKTFLDVDY